MAHITLSQANYDHYYYMVNITDVTSDPGWKRLLASASGPHICNEIKMLIDRQKQSESCMESIVWIRSMDELVKEFPDILERLETTFKPIYEAAKAFDKWA